MLNPFVRSHGLSRPSASRLRNIGKKDAGATSAGIKADRRFDPSELVLERVSVTWKRFTELPTHMGHCRAWATQYSAASLGLLGRLSSRAKTRPCGSIRTKSALSSGFRANVQRGDVHHVSVETRHESRPFGTGEQHLCAIRR